MSSHAPNLASGIVSFAPPYRQFNQVGLGGISSEPGYALAWYVRDAHTQEKELQLLGSRPACVPLVVLLPEPAQIKAALPLVERVPWLRPRAVLPHATLGSARYVREVLATPPPHLPAAVCSYLDQRGMLPSDRVRMAVKRIFELAPEVPSISQLSARLYMSRRTLGRLFAAEDLPVPSHWLQFARLLHASVRLQAGKHSVLRVGASMGYPDGFTLSNQMNRLIGVRPSVARKLLGWEWIVEAWLSRESRS